MRVVIARIDRDYLWEPGEDPKAKRVGVELSMDHDQYNDLFNGVAESLVKVRFRCKDDDGQVYYGGWLLNDVDCDVQFEVLRWAQADAGCTTIEVKEPKGSWRQEIG